jgi:hypothetical protein
LGFEWSPAGTLPRFLRDRVGKPEVIGEQQLGFRLARISQRNGCADESPSVTPATILIFSFAYVTSAPAAHQK